MLKRGSSVSGTTKETGEEGESDANVDFISPDVDSKVAVQGKALKRSKYGRFVVRFGKTYFHEFLLFNTTFKIHMTFKVLFSEAD